jgi:integrase
MGPTKDIGLGPLHTVSLAEAREAALAQRKLRRSGVDPTAARKSEKAQARAAATTRTFAECAQAYFTSREAGFTPRHARQWLSPLVRFVYPTLGGLPVDQIDTRLIIAVLAPIWQDRRETALRTRGRIEQVLDWARVHGFRSGDNPAAAALVGKGLPELSREDRAADRSFAAMPYRDLPDFMVRLRGSRARGAGALEFLILTAARTGDVRGATWSEIDAAAALWTIPATRMKASRRHVVPLSGPAMACLPERRGPTARIFPIGEQAMRYLLQTSLGAATADLHGFQSSFRDWCAENGIDDRLAEFSLAHGLQDATEAAYHRTNLVEQRRPVMEAWARFCAGEATDNVITLPRPAALG